MPPALKATWRSGDAAVCKTVYPGSIPGVASNIFQFIFVDPKILWVPLRCC
jgi:hypothetical protein